MTKDRLNRSEEDTEDKERVVKEKIDHASPLPNFHTVSVPEPGDLSVDVYRGVTSNQRFLK